MRREGCSGKLVSLIFMPGNNLEETLEMFLLFALTPRNLFKSFLSIRYDCFTKFEYLTKWSFADIEALAEMELTSVPFILNSSLRGKILKKDYFCCWKLPYALFRSACWQSFWSPYYHFLCHWCL